MYQKTYFCDEDEEEKGTFEMILPDEVESLLRTLPLYGGCNYEEFMDSLVNELREELGNYKNLRWLDKETLKPVKYAKFYAIEIGYHDGESRDEYAEAKEPKDYIFVGWFLDYVDVNFGNLCPGNGNIRFLCDRILGNAYDARGWYLDEVKEAFRNGELDKQQEQILLKIYPELLQEYKNRIDPREQI